MTFWFPPHPTLDPHSPHLPSPPPLRGRGQSPAGLPAEGEGRRLAQAPFFRRATCIQPSPQW